MSLLVSNQVVALQPGSNANTSPAVQITATGGGLATKPLLFTSAAVVTGSVWVGVVGGDDNTVTLRFNSSPDAIGTFTGTLTNPNTTPPETADIIITVAPSTSNSPRGYKALDLVSMIRLRTNEPNLPLTADVLTLANAGVAEIERQLGGIRLLGIYPTVPNQTVQALTDDIQDIVSCSWSTGPVLGAGSIVSPMEQLPEISFTAVSGGFPSATYGTPAYYFIYRDQGGVMEMQMYPAAMLGQLNVYYRARPQLWTLDSSGNSANASNLDPSAQEAVVLWTCARVLENRGRGGEAAQIFTPQFQETLADLKSAAGKRLAPKSGQVRAVWDW